MFNSSYCINCLSLRSFYFKLSVFMKRVFFPFLRDIKMSNTLNAYYIIL
jgi:hypothetical protein